ncbi:MAG: hypothetical protein ACOYOU_18725 [Kiritimatiellia bacterium]
MKRGETGSTAKVAKSAQAECCVDAFEAASETVQEVYRARKKFPGNQHLLAALMEEVGELAKEMLEHGNSRHARTEAMQVACVAIRIMTEGDSDYTPDEGGAA